MNIFIVAISCSLVRIATGDDVTTQSSRFNDFDQSKDSKRVVLKGDCLVVCDASTDQQQRGGGGGSPGGGYGGFGRQVWIIYICIIINNIYIFFTYLSNFLVIYVTPHIYFIIITIFFYRILTCKVHRVRKRYIYLIT